MLLQCYNSFSFEIIWTWMCITAYHHAKNSYKFLRSRWLFLNIVRKKDLIHMNISWHCIKWIKWCVKYLMLKFWQYIKQLLVFHNVTTMFFIFYKKQLGRLEILDAVLCLQNTDFHFVDVFSIIFAIFALMKLIEELYMLTQLNFK